MHKPESAAQTHKIPGNSKSMRRYRDPTNWKVCSKCGRGPKPVAAMSEQREPICHACYQKARYWSQSSKPRPRPSQRSSKTLGRGKPPPRHPGFKMAWLVPHQTDPNWLWCADCQDWRPNVRIGADKRGRCAKHDLAWLRQRAAARRLVNP